ncbi:MULTISPECIES: DUF4149 domain-containing protein [Ramlibacter]|uniref:DUF4149 domain-containing protein n=1 Tax=Ramlibacter aquaticus TaxID=2780094 RepID=A0ABR9SG03_9BURK|nr:MULTISPECIES: DUF4149 domain-containing protein [Ramlibacter]MBE7941273.1 DUF4149 domain-containing protein [Ramlibacter aquaticus]
MGWRARIPLLAAALWWGSLSAIGFLAVPLLFRHLPTPALAGSMAAQLFSAQAGVSVACGALILMASRGPGEPARLGWRGGALAFVLVGVLMALLVEYGVSPHIRARENLALWHGVGSLMYGLQWLCALVALWKLGAPGPMQDQAGPETQAVPD